jgi:hypothetical protein
MGLYANLDTDNKVLQVIVCDRPDWIDKNLKGTWVETQPTDEKIQGAGKGLYFSDNNFFFPWTPLGENDEGLAIGEKRWSAGIIWKNTVSGNKDQPGIGNGRSSWKNTKQGIVTKTLNKIKSFFS